MSRSTAAGTHGVNLMPLLDVLLCTMGTLIVILGVINREARLHPAKRVPGKAAAQQQEMIDAKEDLQLRLQQLTTAREKTLADLENSRRKLAGIEDSARQMQDHLQALVAAAKDLKTTADNDSQREQLRAALAKLNAERQQLEKDLQHARMDSAHRQPAYAVVPFEGMYKTNRRPIYIECREESVILQPEGIVFGPEDFLGPGGPNNPLASALRAAQEYWRNAPRPAPDLPNEPYPLLLVRPDGIIAYYLVRDAMSSWDAEFGYELVGENWKLDFPMQLEPQLKDQEERAVAEARQQLEWLAKISPELFARKSNKQTEYHVSPFRGGVVRDGGPSLGDDPFADDPLGGFGHSGARGGWAGNNPNGGSPYGDNRYGGTSANGTLAYGGNGGVGTGITPNGTGNMAGGGLNGNAAFGNGMAGPNGYGPNGYSLGGPGNAVSAGGLYGGGPGNALPGNNLTGNGSGENGFGPGTGSNGAPMLSGPALGVPGSGPGFPNNQAGGGSGYFAGGNGDNGMQSSGAGGNQAGAGGPEFANVGPRYAGTGNGTGSFGNNTANNGGSSSGSTANNNGQNFAHGVAASGNYGSGGSGSPSEYGGVQLPASAMSPQGSGTASAGSGSGAPGTNGQNGMAGAAGTAGSEQEAPGNPYQSLASSGAMGGTSSSGSYGNSGSPGGAASGDGSATSSGSDSSGGGGASSSMIGSPSSNPNMPGGAPNMSFDLTPQQQNAAAYDQSTQQQQSSSSTRSMAKNRGRNWALPTSHNASMAIDRPIRVECWPDRLVLVPDTHDQQAQVIPLGERTEDAVDPLVGAVRSYTKTWGIAGRGMYWRPQLVLNVNPNADARAADLQTLLADSGWNVKRK